MRLIVMINVFNEAQHIGKAIESVHDVADEIWVFDGAYENYPHDNPQSTDGTLDIVKKYPKAKLFTQPESKAWRDQITKRSAMFEYGQDGDYFFRLDGDEYVLNPEEIRENLDTDIGWVWTLSNLYPKPVMTARIFKYQKGLHYAGRHHWVFNGNNVFVASDQKHNGRFKAKDTNIRVFNYRDSSTAKRVTEKGVFLRNRNPGEIQYPREDKVYNKFVSRLIEHPNRAGKPIRKTSVVREIDNPTFTFTSMISRDWALERYFKSITNLKLPESIEAVIVVDSDRSRMKEKVYKFFEADKRFKGVKIIFTNNPRLPESSQVHLRRQRIIDNWHLLMCEARGEFIIGSEDDSLPEKNAYMKLLDSMAETGADFIQGNIIARWSARICPAWKMINKGREPIIVWNSREKKDGIEQIYGVGWYCFITRTDLMRKYPMYLDSKTPLGPDVRFGYELAKHGYVLMHDWNVKVIHFGQEFEYIPGKQETEQRIWYRKDKDTKWNTIPFKRDSIITLGEVLGIDNLIEMING